MAYSNEIPIGTIMPFAGYYYLPNQTYEQMRVLNPELTPQDHNKGQVSSALMAESGWLLCDGRLYRFTTNPEDDLFYLCRAIGTAWGGNQQADGYNFRVPDLRGVFLRGVTTFSALDPDVLTRTKLFPTDNFGETGNQVGSFQNDTIKSHSHIVTAYTRQTDDGGVNNAGSNGDLTRGVKRNLETTTVGGLETRSKNVYVHYLIKAAHKSLGLVPLLDANKFE